MKPRVFPLAAAARLFIERQHLARPRATRLTARSLSTFVEDVGGLQLDSINVLDRAHYLTAWSRFGVYDRASFDRLAYRRRVLFEYWAHAACLVSAGHLPWWRRAMLDYGVHHTGWSVFLRKNAKVLTAVEESIRDRGPLGNADFKRPRPGGGGGWWSWRPTTHALHYLWMKGRTAVHSRKHFQKRFDVIDRVLPAALSVEPASPEDFKRWHMTRSLHAMGAATEVDLRMYLTFPRTPATARRRTLQAMLRSGEVVEVGIEGDRNRWYALAEDLPALASAARRRGSPSRGTGLLAPFDSFLWHRARTKKLFGFDYTIEVYVPGHKRVHGYYSLPILHDGRLIGRLDAKSHRAEGRLEVKNVHFERWLAAGTAPPLASWGAFGQEAALAGVAEALRSLAAFVGASRVTLGRVAPSRMRPALARALRKAPSLEPARSVEEETAEADSTEMEPSL